MGRTLTADEKWARQLARIEKQSAARAAHRARSGQLRGAIASMALRWAQAARRSERAHQHRDTTAAERYDRVAQYRHLALLRLLYALEDHANREKR